MSSVRRLLHSLGCCGEPLPPVDCWHQQKASKGGRCSFVSFFLGPHPHGGGGGTTPFLCGRSLPFLSLSLSPSLDVLIPNICTCWRCFLSAVTSWFLRSTEAGGGKVPCSSAPRIQIRPPLSVSLNSICTSLLFGPICFPQAIQFILCVQCSRNIFLILMLQEDTCSFLALNRSQFSGWTPCMMVVFRAQQPTRRRTFGRLSG